jgi:hypothetical protein
MSAVLQINEADPLSQAVQAYIEAKRREDIATAARIAAEDRIIALHPAKQEGSETFEAGGYKVTLTGRLAYKCAHPALLAAACKAAGWEDNSIPVKTEIKLDETGAKWLRANKPEQWRQIAEYVEIKPAKTGVKVGV